MNKKLTIEEMHRCSVEEYKAAQKLPLVVVLDNVRSLHNVGSVFRTADACGIERVVLCGITACPPSVEIHKTALGAEDSVDWLHVDDTLDAVKQLQDEGYDVWAIEQTHDSVKLTQELLNAPDVLHTTSDNRHLAIVLGNEVKGVRQDVVDACAGAIEIPQYGTKHSLNVSVTAGIVIWALSQCLGENK